MVTALASLLGGGAEAALRAIGYLSLGALVVAVFRLGQVVHSPPAGAVAAALVGTSPPVLQLGATAAKDIAFCALIVVSLVLEVQRPRRGQAVMALLALAGLLRPEAWLLAGAYWLHIAPTAAWPRRVGTGALALAAPAVWMLTDLAITGEPLFSLTRTRELTVQLGRETGLTSVPSAFVDGLADVITPVGVAGGAAGLVLAVWLWPRRATAPAVLVGLTAAGFVALGVAGLPLGARYLLLPGMVLAALYGLAVLGWLGSERTRRRELWIAGGALLLAGLATMAPGRAGELDRLTEALEREARIAEDLKALDRDPVAARALAGCARIHFHAGVYDALVPYLSYQLDRDANDFAPVQAELPDRGALLVPAGRAPLPGFRRAAGNESWRVYRRGCGTRRAASAVMSVQPRSR